MGKTMTKVRYRKTFTYWERVRIVRPGKRTICVQVKSGAGIGFRARSVRKGFAMTTTSARASGDPV